MTNDERQNEHTQPSSEATPAELRGVLPHLEGEPDEDPVLDAEEEAAENKGMVAHDDTEHDDTEEEYIDADDLMELLGQLRDMLETQAKEIRGLRREMRELREAGGVQSMGPSQGQSQGYRPREDRGERNFGGDRGFRPREDRGGFGNDRGNDRGGFRPREDRGERSFGGDRGFRPREDRGGFRPREDRGGFGNNRGGERNFGDREFRPRDGGDEGGFRPRARADRGWGNKRSDEE